MAPGLAGILDAFVPLLKPISLFLTKTLLPWNWRIFLAGRLAEIGEKQSGDCR